MKKLEFVFEMQSEYEDEEENLECEQVLVYEGETIQDCLQDAADGWDFDDEDVINFDADSDLVGTNRDMISIWELKDDQRLDVTLDLCDEYQRLHDKSFADEML